MARASRRSAKWRCTRQRAKRLRQSLSSFCDGLPDFCRRREPDALGVGDVLQRAAQMPQAVRLADEIWMERDAHDERLRSRLRQHLVEVIDDHVGEVAP